MWSMIRETWDRLDAAVTAALSAIVPSSSATAVDSTVTRRLRLQSTTEDITASAG
jgi:hypothetical protein